MREVEREREREQECYNSFDGTRKFNKKYNTIFGVFYTLLQRQFFYEDSFSFLIYSVKVNDVVSSVF